MTNKIEEDVDEQYDVLLIDVNNVFTQQYTGFDYCREDGTDISGVYGTLRAMQYLVSKYHPRFVVAVFDGKGGSSKKRKMFPDYKKNRGMPMKVNYRLVNKNAQLSKKQIDDCRANYVYQLQLLHEFLSFLPIHRVVAQGYEADELMGYVVSKMLADERKLIVSNDKDFHQLIDENTHIYDPRKRELKKLDFLKKQWGTDNTRLLTILRSIDGDLSDKIGGIDGLKIRGIQKYFPDLFERDDITELKHFEDFLRERIQVCEEKKAEFASNWKTIRDKAKFLLEGENKDGTKCIEIIHRNYDLMQLFSPELSLDTILLLRRYLNVEPKFNSPQYMMKILQEGLRIEGKSTEMWERQFRNLQFNQKKFAKRLIEID